MKTLKKHIINKVFLEVDTTSKEKAYYIKDHLDVFLKDHVFPLLEDRFDMLEDKISGKSLQIQRLDLTIDLNEKMDFNEIKDQIVHRTNAEIEKSIINSSDPKKENSIILNTEQSTLKTFFFFLENGHTPWYHNNEEFSFLIHLDALEALIKETGFVRGFIDRLHTPVIRKRLIYQFSDTFIYTMLRTAFIPTVVTKDRIWSVWVEVILSDQLLQIIQQQNKQDRFRILEAIFLGLANRDSTIFNKEAQNIRVLNESKKAINLIDLIAISIKDTRFKNVLDKSNKSNSFDLLRLDGEKLEVSKEKNELPNEDQENIETIEIKDLETKKDVLDISSINPQKEKSISLVERNKSILDPDLDAIIETDYYMDNAGLMMLHPFLKQFFESCNILKGDKEFEDPELAVHLLHYMATKEEQQSENLMIFEKFMCNIPIHEPISRNVTISETHKEKIEELLDAVIEHWGALQNASPDLLRHEFLQRPGKLILKGKNPKIILERKTQDILIDRLPWNLSLIKLPWHTQLIFMDW